jgi:hypothetical protein
MTAAPQAASQREQQFLAAAQVPAGIDVDYFEGARKLPCST